MILALDTSCVVALLCEWHEEHRRTFDGVTRRLASGGRLLLPAHALIEAYSVLTRLPPPHRLAPEAALALLDGNFRGTQLSALPAEGHWTVLRDAPAAKIAGGRTYDAVIATSARLAGAGVLITWNLRHFSAFADDALAVEIP